MALAAEKELKHIGETSGCPDHDHDLAEEPGRDPGVDVRGRRGVRRAVQRRDPEHDDEPEDQARAAEDLAHALDPLQLAPHAQRQFREHGIADAALKVPAIGRFRINLHHERGRPAAITTQTTSAVTGKRSNIR